jgi:diacylglycerol kinase family enzyme
VEKRGALKRYAGHPLFIWASAATWASGYDRRRPHFQVEYPDGTRIEDAFFTLVQNTDPYTFLGNRPMHVSGASLDTALSALTLRSLKLPTLLGVLGTAFGVGRPYATMRKVDLREQLIGLTVTSDAPFPYQVDGDHLGNVTRLEFRYEPDAISLVIP